jgi:hypothetical protein
MVIQFQLFEVYSKIQKKGYKMTPGYNPISLLRQLKGAPLSVLLALSILRQPASEQILSRVTGYSEKVTRDAAHYLQEIGVVGRNARFSGWVLLKDVFQLPLMPGDSMDSDPAGACHQIGDCKLPIDPEDCHQITERYYLPVADDTSTSSSFNGRHNEVVLENRRRIKESNGNIYRSNPAQPGQLSTYQQNCINLLHHHFVGEPKASRLITLPHVNLTYLIGHVSDRIRQCEKAQEWGRLPTITIGTMICKIENNDRQPKTMIEYNSASYEFQDKLDALEEKAHNEIIDWSDYWRDPPN